ncbi:hypothetical protein CRUP_003982, partial [Coryphaenoides rupestris]
MCAAHRVLGGTVAGAWPPRVVSAGGSKAVPRPGGIGSAAVPPPGMEGDSMLSKILPGGAAEQAGKLGDVQDEDPPRDPRLSSQLVSSETQFCVPRPSLLPKTPACQTITITPSLPPLKEPGDVTTGKSHHRGGSLHVLFAYSSTSLQASNAGVTVVGAFLLSKWRRDRLAGEAWLFYTDALAWFNRT